MRAAVLTAFGAPLELADVAAPEILGPSDVIVRVTGAGVCGSDVHLIDGLLVDAIGAPAFPYVLGHENAGFVEEVGAGVRTVAPGDAVLLHPHITCGLCRACRRGEEAYCESLRFPGIDGTTAGGFAELVRTDEHALVLLPPGTDPTPLAPLADAGLSAYHAVRKSLRRLAPDGTAVVVGASGGLGSFALQLLRVFSPARLIAIDVSDERLAQAPELGADVVLTAGDDLVDRVLEETSSHGADLVIDCVGTGPTPAQSLAMLRRGGAYSVLGAGDAEVCCGTLPLTGRELAIEGSLVGTLGELTELAGIAVRGRLHLVQSYYPLQDAARAIDDLRSGSVDGRAVLLPTPSP